LEELMLKLFVYLLAICTFPSALTQGLEDLDSARIEAVYARLAAAHHQLGLGTSFPSLIIHYTDWPIEPESFAFEQTSLTTYSTIHIFKPWAMRSTDDAIAFALAHEAGHGLCQHYFKTLGLYALHSKAVGASLSILDTGMRSDFAFKFSHEATESAMEIEADAYAALALREADFNAHAGIEHALALSTGGFAHPHGRERIGRALSTLGSHQKAKPFLLDCQRRDPESY